MMTVSENKKLVKLEKQQRHDFDEIAHLKAEVSRLKRTNGRLKMVLDKLKGRVKKLEDKEGRKNG